MALPLSPQPGHLIVLSAALAVMIALERTVRNFPAALITIGFGIGAFDTQPRARIGVRVVGKFITLQLGSSAWLDDSYVGPLLRSACP